ncbi:MAG: hypothetical protein HOP13_17700 [Alphaproteobacteria bacterium]|nr:hypothetical protein [Alphaproteobacteria bacterium]
MYNLWNFDPWSSDFREWRAAARLPNAGAQELKPQIRMKIETWRDGDAKRAENLFVLLPTTDPADAGPLAAEKRAGYSVTAYRIDPTDYDRLAALRARVLASKKAGDGLRGSLAITAAACGAGENLPKGAFLISTYLLVDRKDGYNPLLIDYDLSEALRKAAAQPKKDAVCG